MTCMAFPSEETRKKSAAGQAKDKKGQKNNQFLRIDLSESGRRRERIEE